MELHPELAALLYPVMDRDLRDKCIAVLRIEIADPDAALDRVAGACDTLSAVLRATPNAPIDGGLYEDLLYFGLVEETDD